MNYLEREKKTLKFAIETFLNTSYFWFNSILVQLTVGMSFVSLQALLSNGNQYICQCGKLYDYKNN